MTCGHRIVWEPVGASLWVGRLEISAATTGKVRAKHGLDAEDVRAAVECRAGLQFVWNDHPERGTRAIIRTFIGGRPVLVVLYPARSSPFGDTFHLGSAYPDNS